MTDVLDLRADEVLETSAPAFPAYAVYKDSGVEWLGEIPAHWEMKGLKLVAGIQTGLTLGKNYLDRTMVTRPYLRVANVQDGYLDLEDITEIAIPEENVKSYELRPGDVLMTEGGDFDKLGRGFVWMGQIEGCLHQNHVFAVRPAPQYLESRFLAALMTSTYGKAYFTSTSQQTTNLATTNSTKLKNFPLLLPPLSEQHTIVTYLDRETTKLDTLIAQKERLIALLEEKRVALISEAVTKGLDLSVPMRESGVEWLGEIPLHWVVAPMYSRYSIQLGKMLDKDAVRGTNPMPYLRNMNVQWDRVDLSHIVEMDFDESEREKFSLKSGDLLVCEGGEVGRTAIWRGELENCFFQKAIHRLRPHRQTEEGRFLFYVLYAAARCGVFEAEGNKSTIIHLTAEKLKRHRFAFAPTHEQRIIVAYLDRETAKLDALTAKIRQQIEKLREYRTALISAAVTGKIDVRAAMYE